MGVSDSSNFLTPVHMWKYGAWAQDDWKVTNKLTLNLGARYDLIWNAFAQNVTFLPFELANRPQDANNIQPRLGFAYTLTHRRVLRGGAGLYYNDELNTNVLWPMSPLTIAVIGVRQHDTAPRGLRGQPVQRAAADVSAGARALLQRGRRRRGQPRIHGVGSVRLRWRGALPAARPAGVWHRFRTTRT